MSETILSSTSVETSAVAGPLLAAAGATVAITAGATAVFNALGALALELEKPLSTDSLAGEFVSRARRERERLAAAIPALQTEGERRASEAIAEGRAVEHALRSLSPVVLAAEAQSPMSLLRSVHLLAQAAEDQEKGRCEEAVRKAREAESTFMLAVDGALERLGKAQHEIVAQTAEDALRALGYRVERAQERGRTALRATSAGAVIGVVVRDAGRLLIEAAGFEGAACRPVISAFFDRLRKEGVYVAPEVGHSHRHLEGGALLSGGSPDARSLLKASAKLESEPEGSAKNRAAEDRRLALRLRSQGLLMERR